LRLSERPSRCRVRRSLVGDGQGAFRVAGRYATATIHAARWLVRDTCAGTLTRVREGEASVRDKVRHRTVTVRAGQRYTARR
jgi:hypothetical protein